MGKNSRLTKPAEPGKVIDEWRVSKTDVLRVSIDAFQGHTLVGIRRWFRDAAGVRCAGRKGISISPEDLPRLRKALRRIYRQLRDK